MGCPAVGLQEACAHYQPAEGKDKGGCASAEEVTAKKHRVGERGWDAHHGPPAADAGTGVWCSVFVRSENAEAEWDEARKDTARFLTRPRGYKELSTQLTIKRLPLETVRWRETQE